MMAQCSTSLQQKEWGCPTIPFSSLPHLHSAPGCAFLLLILHLWRCLSMSQCHLFSNKEFSKLSHRQQIWLRRWSRLHKPGQRKERHRKGGRGNEPSCLEQQQAVTFVWLHMKRQQNWSVYLFQKLHEIMPCFCLVDLWARRYAGNHTSSYCNPSHAWHKVHTYIITFRLIFSAWSPQSKGENTAVMPRDDQTCSAAPLLPGHSSHMHLLTSAVEWGALKFQQTIRNQGDPRNL